MEWLPGTKSKEITMLDVNSLYHDYEGKGRYAVQNVTFQIAQGEIFGFLGPSGAGKSTVQNILTGLLPLQRGEVAYEGVNIRKVGVRFFNSLGVSFEHPNLYGRLTGYENLKYFAGLFDVPTLEPMALLEAVGLTEAAHRKVSAYSKGMRQRLVFARALINQPKMLFLDEPTSGLDPNTASNIKGLIRQKQEQGSTIFLTTHNMLVADELCNRVAFINDGCIVAMNTPRNLKLQHGERSVRVEYGLNGSTDSSILFLDNPADQGKLNSLLQAGQVQTIHSQEATLEQIFIKMTGRGLS
jgi:fluoroquinolone transport system ATP-binding protein